MQPHHSKQAGSLFTALVMVFTILGLPLSPARAGAPALARFIMNSLSTPVTTITRVSVASNGLQGNSWSDDPVISTDGLYVAFFSNASNLVSGDNNGEYDVFLHNTQTGITTRVSVNSYGEEGNGFSEAPTISADGRYVAFLSSSDNLVSGDTNYTNDIFLRDTQTSTTTRISVDSSGTQANEISSSPSISADGRYVAFTSNASNLVGGDTNGTQDIFLRDTLIGTTTRISVDSSGKQGNADSVYPSISADGRYVAFISAASNLVSGDTNGKQDIFLHDTQTGTTTRLSVDSNGKQGNGNSYGQSISADGRCVTFTSDASNLVGGDGNNTSDVFLRDTQPGITTRLSVNSNGAQANYHSESPSISANGHLVAFSSAASNLISGDTNEVIDLFLRDIQAGSTSRLPLDSTGIQGNRPSLKPHISADGRYVTFFSDATNLVSGDTNGTFDVFIAPATIYIYRIYLPLAIR